MTAPKDRDALIEVMDQPRCQGCNGNGTYHVCSWVCVDMPCLSTKPCASTANPYRKE